MVVYTCHCLNVQVFAEKSNEALAKNDALVKCPLWPSCEVVELIDQGFQFSHKCLVQRLRDGEWTVYVCVPCHLRTHAVNHDSRLVVISLQMEKGEEALKALKIHADYSPVFNLVLRSSEGKLRDDGVITPQTHETLQKQLGDLHDVLVKYLKEEEEAMERRIRTYEEDQRNNFARLKEDAQSEKAKLISVLFHNSEGSNHLNSQDRSSVRGHVQLIQSKSANEYGGKEVLSRTAKGIRNRRLRDSSPDVFAMDELEIEEDDDDAVLRSDHDQLHGNRNNSNVEQSGRTRNAHLESTDEYGNDKLPLMSTSVPISMPAQARNIRNLSYLDDDIEESAEFADIPRHMQALSESIQERDRYIFGDRPRQRVHTGDFTQVNWH
ncbi:unnamed protein product [Lymnaea stagnalis]|uniref:Uncharacterized protein n=1 Tax=Lymnaea stagnalis TaxID=6523 RepID=A0AAV2IPH7_LYMST